MSSNITYFFFWGHLFLHWQHLHHIAWSHLMVIVEDQCHHTIHYSEIILDDLWWIPLMMRGSECDISSRDFSVSRLFSIFWEYRSRSRKFLSRKKVSVSVSKKFSLKKKSRYRSRKYLVSKKSLGIGLENFGLKKSLGIGLEIFVSKTVSGTT